MGVLAFTIVPDDMTPARQVTPDAANSGGEALS